MSIGKAVRILGRVFACNEIQELESRENCEHKSVLECTLSTGIPDGSYHNETCHGAEKKYHVLEYISANE